jgi:hypothetical protein
MTLFTSIRCRSAIVALAAAAGLCGLCTASAQDARLTVHAEPNVVHSGESATVRVLARFPSTHYAFAFADFNVRASHPRWTFASNGVLASAEVFSVAVGQKHSPMSGVFANPANPYLFWQGVHTPASNAPALVHIGVIPTSFAVYPSRRSPSAVHHDVVGGTDYLMVNPLSAGRWLAAPGAGSAITVTTNARSGDDVIVDGRIITAGADPSPPLLIGLLLPAVQAVREGAARVDFDGLPDSFSAGVQLERSGIPTDTFSLNYSKVVFNQGSRAMSISIEAPAGGPVAFGGFNGGVRVAAADLNVATPNGAPMILLPSIPPRSSVRLARWGQGRVFWKLQFDAPVQAHIRGRDGRLQPCILDSIEITAPISRPGSVGAIQSNLKQIGLALHTFEARGVRGMRVTPAQPR